jgi:hypothetical protein
MRINPRKIRKILGRIWTDPKRILETFCTQETPDECNTHIELIYFYSENQTKDFSYNIFPVKKNKCWKKFKNYEKIVI